MDKKFIIILAVILAAFASIVVFNKNDSANVSSTSGANGSSNVYGKADSPVVLTEFVDFQCEACYAYYPYVKQLKEKYKDSVRFEIKNFPITSSHQFALQAARSAEAAARQGKFFEMHDLIFENQKTWEKSQEPQPFFNSYAKQIGIDMKKFDLDRKSSSVNSAINKDLADVKKLGGDGTPTFVLNGKKIKNPDPTLEALSKIVDEALKKAGVAPSTSPSQPVTSTAPVPTSTGLNPGETQAEHDRETQQTQQ